MNNDNNKVMAQVQKLKMNDRCLFLENFYHPQDQPILESVNCSLHFLGKSLPGMRLLMTKIEFNERFKLAMSTIKEHQLI